MTAIEVSTIFRTSAEAAWDFLFADGMRRAAELSKMAVGVEGYEMREDGTPRYTLVSKFGPFTLRGTSDYFQFERPHATANRILDSPLGGTFTMTFEPVRDGTRVTEHWEIEPQNSLAALIAPLARPVITKALTRDLRAWAAGAASAQP